MAKIAINEIFDEKAIKAQVEKVNALLNTTITIVENNANAAKLLNAEFGNTKGLKEVTDAFVKLNKIENDNAIAAEKLTQAQLKTVQMQEKTTKIVKDNESAYKKLSNELNENRKTWKDLAVANKENSEEGKKLLETIKQQDAALKKVDATVGQHQRNVGAYKEAVATVNLSLGEMKRELMALRNTSFAGKSEEEVKALKLRIGELMDGMQDLKTEMQVLGTEKAAVLVSGLKFVAAGVEGVVGSLSLMGVENDVIKKLETKMTSLIAVTQALAEIEDVVTSGKLKAIAFRIKDMTLNGIEVIQKWALVTSTTAQTNAQLALTKMKQTDSVVTYIVTAAQWAWNAAISASPIGWIIGAVVLLTAGIFALTKVMSDEDTVLKRYNDNLINLKKNYGETAEKIKEVEQTLRLKKGLISQNDFDEWKEREENKVRLSKIYSDMRADVERANLFYTSEMKRIIDEDNSDKDEKLIQLALNKGRTLSEIDQQMKSNIKANTQLFLLNMEKLDFEAKQKAEKEAKKAEKITERFNIFKLKSVKDTNKQIVEDESKRLSDSINIQKEYRTKYTELLDSDMQKDADYENWKLQLIVDSTTDEKELLKAKRAQLEQERIDELTKYAKTKEDEERINLKYKLKSESLEKTHQEIIKQIKQAAWQASADVFRGLVDLQNASFQQDLQNIDEKANKDKEAKEKELEAAGNNAALKDEINKKYAAKEKALEKERRKIEIERAKFQKAAAIFGIILDTSKAIVSHLTQPWLIPFDVLTGGIQLAVAAAQPVPKYKTGRKGGKAEIATVSEEGVEGLKLKTGEMFLTPEKESNIFIPEGASIIPHKELIKNVSFENLPSYNNTFNLQLQSLGSKVDGLHKSLYYIADTVKNKQETYINITEKGLYKILKNGNNITEYINAKYKS